MFDMKLLLGILSAAAAAVLQVDLSDDYVLFMMFADGQWEDDMTAIEFEEEGGKAEQLKMSEKEFQSFIGILKEPDEEPSSRRK
jgi:hypothetical protein